MTPDYNYKKVWKYMKMFRHAAQVSEEWLTHETPKEHYNPEGKKVPKEDKNKFIVPTPLTIKRRAEKETQQQELYIVMTPFDVQIRERGSFMDVMTRHIRQKAPQYQKTFGELLAVYTKNRLLATLPEHEKWKADSAAKLYTETEDYLKAYIAAQTLYNTEEEDEEEE